MHANDLEFAVIEQHFPRPRIENVAEEVRREILKTGIRFQPGSRIAITVGSRGINNLAQAVRAVADEITRQGAHPFVIPAMGSHGGATAQGQREVLASYGVTEENVHAPVVSSLDVVTLPNPGGGFSVFMSKDAYESDGVVVLNRVKLHTDFHGPVESGIMKMCVIGLGKHAQALEIHRYGTYGLREYMPAAAREVIKTGKVLLGIGLVENAFDETMCVRAALAQDIERTDAQLLAISKENMPSLPIDKLDLLIVDEQGKDKSGTGLDTNIIGRIRIRDQEDPEYPKISYIFTRTLTDESHGNAIGMGLSDFITREFYDKIDFHATYENVITSSFIERGRMPIVAKDSVQGVEWALRAMGPRQPDEILAARIKSTLEITRIQVSKAALARIKASPVWVSRSVTQCGGFAPAFAGGDLSEF